MFRKGQTRRRRGALEYTAKPSGRVDERVRGVGPEHFGIVCVDPHKGSSEWMFTDFYGKVWIAPREVAHAQPQLQACLELLRRSSIDCGIKDLVVVIERTGEYHQPIRRAFEAWGYEVRIIHPFTTKQYRMPANPGEKSDTNDLGAMQRATVNGLGLREAALPPLYGQLQLLVRHRRDLVGKCSSLRCQIREQVESALPGYAALFAEPFESDTFMTVARHFATTAAVLQAGVAGLAACLREAKVRFRQSTLQKMVAWAGQAAPGAALAALHQQIWTGLDNDRVAKAREIQQLEGQISSLLVQTPYVLLVAFPGIAVVSAAELAGEMGPIEHYLSPNAITGRAGLCPARSQSHLRDHADGPLRRQANRRLRAALLQIAGDLVVCNHYFRTKAEAWKLAGKDPCGVRVRAAKLFSRLAYAILATRRWFPHRALQPRHYVLDKLLAFQQDHDLPMSQRQQDLAAVVPWIPAHERAAEGATLKKPLDDWRAGRRRAGPVRLGELLPIVLEKLGVGSVQSEGSEEPSPS